jgi:hypothetical protein
MRNFLNGLTLIFLVTNIACKQSPSSESEIIETPKTETLEFSHQIEGGVQNQDSSFRYEYKKHRIT